MDLRPHQKVKWNKLLPSIRLLECISLIVRLKRTCLDNVDAASLYAVMSNLPFCRSFRDSAERERRIKSHCKLGTRPPNSELSTQTRNSQPKLGTLLAPKPISAIASHETRRPYSKLALPNSQSSPSPQLSVETRLSQRFCLFYLFVLCWGCGEVLRPHSCHVKNNKGNESIGVIQK